MSSVGTHKKGGGRESGTRAASSVTTQGNTGPMTAANPAALAGYAWRDERIRALEAEIGEWRDVVKDYAERLFEYGIRAERAEARVAELEQDLALLRKEYEGEVRSSEYSWEDFMTDLREAREREED